MTPSPLKILFIAPHLSTGGMPAFLLKRIELLKSLNYLELFVVEFKDYSPDYVVQKNKIKELIGNNFYTLGEDKSVLLDIIINNNIDVVHIDEIPERFDHFNKFPEEVLGKLYTDNRKWRIVETCHSASYNHYDKIYHPDAYAFCTPHHLMTFDKAPSPKYVIEFPIEEKLKVGSTLTLDINKKHVLNVGLWTSGKNQGQIVELARKLPNIEFHFVGNQAPNFREYWEPIMKNLPSNVIVWGERDDVGNFMEAVDLFLFTSTFECNPLVLREAIGYGLPIIARNMFQYEKAIGPYIIDLNDDDLEHQVVTALISPKQYKIPTNQNEKFIQDHLQMYKEVLITSPQTQVEDISFDVSFIKNPFIEIKGRSPYIYTVKFIDENNECQFETKIRANSWAKCNREWFTKWKIQVWNEATLVYEYVLDFTDKRVFIAMDSGSLGDTIAWLPYCLEFQEKHNCHVIVSTFKNFLFKKVYPELEFVEPSEGVTDLFGMYNIGWYYNPDKEPILPSLVPLQQTASNILGLEHKEIKPRIAYKLSDKPYDKYVTIATNSTAGCKFWTKEGWQEVINYLHNQGYVVVNTSKERNDFDNCVQLPVDETLNDTMNTIYHSEFFIGLSSGLSWLAWALGKPVVMISNFTEYDHEFTSNCIRIVNEEVCHGCWNNAAFKFDKGDWNWCPVHKGTDRQFECHTQITGKAVIDSIKNLLLTNTFSR
jgi:autotransporter strand-loop-strand O-heptosyltransferase